MPKGLGQRGQRCTIPLTLPRLKASGLQATVEEGQRTVKSIGTLGDFSAASNQHLYASLEKTGMAQDPMREASLERPSSWVGDYARGSRVRFKENARQGVYDAFCAFYAFYAFCDGIEIKPY